MQIKTDGIVIKQQKINDNDRYLTILTRDSGVIRAYANKANSIKSAMCSSTAMMSYSDFVITENKGNYRISCADLKKAFFNIGSDLKKISLATYLFEITSEIGVPDSNCEQLLRLLLNTLYFLEQNSVDELVLKSIFEVRALMLCGFAPQLSACCGCGEYESDSMFFSLQSGELVCKDCYNGYSEKGSAKAISSDALKALRYIVFSELKDVFKLRLSPQLAAVLTALTEEYCRFQLEHQFETLNFFYSVMN